MEKFSNIVTKDFLLVKSCFNTSSFCSTTLCFAYGKPENQASCQQWMKFNSVAVTTGGVSSGSTFSRHSWIFRTIFNFLLHMYIKYSNNLAKYCTFEVTLPLRLFYVSSQFKLHALTSPNSLHALLVFFSFNNNTGRLYWLKTMMMSFESVLQHTAFGVCLVQSPIVDGVDC